LLPIRKKAESAPKPKKARRSFKEGCFMSELAAKKGSRAVKIIGIITLIGIIVAVGRIVFRVFNEKSSEPEDGHNGV
jgi:hypothetical protein